LKGLSFLELQDIADWMRNFAVQYGYLGIFLISLLGAMSIFVPIPYTIVIFILGGLQDKAGNWIFDPLWIAVAAGVGAAIGEFSGYLIGFGGRKVIGEKYKKKMDFLTKLFKKFGPMAIFVFALHSVGHYAVWLNSSVYSVFAWEILFQSHYSLQWTLVSGDC
jgi:membrane protein DedA with SNARE-associated domain